MNKGTNNILSGFMGFLILSILIFPPGALASEAEIVDKVRSHLFNTLPWDVGELKVEDIEVKGYRGEIAFDDINIVPSAREKNIGKVTLGAELLRDGDVIRKVYVSARIKVMRPALIAVRSLKIKEEVTRDDLKTVFIEISKNPTDTLTVDSAVGMIVKRPIKAGKVIKSTYLKRKSIIKKGERVRVVASINSIKVISKAQAVEDGYMGVPIRLEGKSGKEFEGTVVANGLVEVNL